MRAEIGSNQCINISQVRENVVAAWINVTADELLDAGVGDVMIHTTLDVNSGQPRVNILVSFLNGATPLNVVTADEQVRATLPAMVVDVVGDYAARLTDLMQQVIAHCRSFAVANFGI